MRPVIADSALLSSMEMYAFLLRPGLAALDNLADKFVAGWLLPSKVLDLRWRVRSLTRKLFIALVTTTMHELFACVNNGRRARNRANKISVFYLLF